MARYCALFSGSKGNATYVGTLAFGVLVDVGVSAKRLCAALCERDIAPETVGGVFITHEHSDHIAGLRVLLKRFHWRVYASAGTLAALSESGALPADADAVALSDAAVAVGDMQVQPFHTPHDARESMGYCFEMPDERRVAVATDMGCLLPQAEALLSSCDLVHIESNHDVGMLQNGPYPYVLQQRILSDHGHLSNAVCAAALPRLAAAGVTRFMLAHLSEQNNTPTLARDTATAALAAAGFAADRDYRLAVAPPVSASPVTIL